MSNFITTQNAPDIKKRQDDFVFQCTMFLMCALNSISKESARNVTRMFKTATTEYGRSSLGIAFDYMKHCKGLSAIVYATDNSIKKHDKNFLETVTRENHTYVEDKYADLLDFTDEKIMPFTNAIKQCVYRYLDTNFPKMVDKRFLTDIFAATSMVVFNEMMFDLLAGGSYSFMKSNPRFTLFRMHKLNDQMVKILGCIDVKDEDGQEIKLNITDVLFHKTIVKILDDLSLFLLSSEFTDKVQQNINKIDPQFRKISKSLVSVFSDITLPMVAYQQRYTNFDYDKFVEKYVLNEKVA